MSFSSLIFVAAFLPLFLVSYTLVPGGERKNTLLLLFSVLFYLFAGIPYLLLLLAETALVFWIAKKMERNAESSTARKEVSEVERCTEGKEVSEAERSGEKIETAEADSAKEERRRSRLLWLGILPVLLLLAFFKYSNPLTELLGESHLPRLALPLGMSFYSFKLLSYLADCWQGRCGAKRYRELLLYVLMFPEVSQGPITRLSELSEELSERSQSWGDAAEGLFRFSVGLGKKTLLADHAGALAEQLLPLDFLSAGSTVSGGAACLAALCYMLQLYLDFSAYSDMAIGLGRFCGFHFPENFNYPYAARSVRDFWRRWHISLSGFFRDYVYIPLGGNRAGFGRMLRNSLAVWLLTGIWHGSSMNFVLWGLYYFFFLTIESLLRRWSRSARGGRLRELGAHLPKQLLSLLAHCYTLLVVYFGWVLFRFSDFRALRAALGRMLGFGGGEFLDSFTWLMLRNNLFFLLLCLVAATPLMRLLGNRMRSSMKRAEDLRRKSLRRQRETQETADFADDSLEGFLPQELPAETALSADTHSQAYQRLRRKIRRRRGEAERAEAVYYLERTVIALCLLALSVLQMVGSSYVPFLYNQF